MARIGPGGPRGARGCLYRRPTALEPGSRDGQRVTRQRGKGACRRAVGGGRPEAEVSEDLFDDRGLLDKRDDPPGSAHWRPTRGSTSYTCLMSRPHARFASEGDISLDSTMAVVASPCAFRRFPRLTLLEGTIPGKSENFGERDAVRKVMGDRW